MLGPLIGGLIGAWSYQLLVGLHWPDEGKYELRLSSVTKHIDHQFKENSIAGREVTVVDGRSNHRHSSKVINTPLTQPIVITEQQSMEDIGVVERRFSIPRPLPN